MLFVSEDSRIDREPIADEGHAGPELPLAQGVFGVAAAVEAVGDVAGRVDVRQARAPQVVHEHAILGGGSSPL